MAGNDANTKILLHLDGADASTTITDDNAGGSAHTWTANGNAQIDTAQSKFGGASGLFDGTGDYASTPDHADFTLGSGDFTCDFWFNVNSSGTRMFACGQIGSAGTEASTSIRVERAVSNVIIATASSGSTPTNVTGTTTYTANGWHHCAFVRIGNTLKLFLDGTQEGGDVAFSSAVNDSSDVWAVGRAGDFASNEWNGWVDELRLSVGVARWSTNFTPPTQAYDRSAFPFQSPTFQHMLVR